HVLLGEQAGIQLLTHQHQHSRFAGILPHHRFVAERHAYDVLFREQIALGLLLNLSQVRILGPQCLVNHFSTFQWFVHTQRHSARPSECARRRRTRVGNIDMPNADHTPTPAGAAKWWVGQDWTNSREMPAPEPYSLSARQGHEERSCVAYRDATSGGAPDQSLLMYSAAHFVKEVAIVCYSWATRETIWKGVEHMSSLLLGTSILRYNHGHSSRGKSVAR